MNYIEEINKLKEQNNAVIVAHYYAKDEIQQIADMVGDSFALSQYCQQVKAQTIVFCGVHFMAESAKILSPNKQVLLPVKEAGCPMADMADSKALLKMKEQYPEAACVCYVNSTAEVKAICDVCCTSSNADKVVNSLNSKQIIFAPDRNLASNIAKNYPEKEIILWEGYCPVHNAVTAQMVKEAKEKHPNALFLVHPECKKEVVELADYAGSTRGILDYCEKSDKQEFIIGTEIGIFYELTKRNPHKKFYKLYDNFICEDMKKIGLKELYNSLKQSQYVIDVDEETIQKSKKSLDRMLKIK